MVKISARGAHPDASNAYWRAHAEIEAHLDATGLPAVVLRPSFLMTNLLAAAGAVRELGVLMAPAGRARVAMIDPADVAEVAARALVGGTITPGVLELSGAEAISHDDVAAVLATVTGGPVTYADVTPEDAIGGLVAAGVPEPAALEVVRIYDALRRGDQATTTDVVARVTGRPATSLTSFAQSHAARFSFPVAS